MHRANEGGDQPLLLQRRKRVAADPVMGVIEIEVAVLGPSKPADVIVDALFDHVSGVTRRGLDGKRDGGATGLAEEAAPRGIRRVQHSLDAEVFERLAESSSHARRRREEGWNASAWRREAGGSCGSRSRAEPHQPFGAEVAKKGAPALGMQRDLASRLDRADRSRVQPARAKQSKARARHFRERRTGESRSSERS